MKTKGLLQLDAMYLRLVIEAADFIDNENAGGDNRNLSSIVTGLIHVAGKMAAQLEDGFDELA
ncbi:hypothetical protein [Paracoccus onubensis]|uniref:Uncharacterized protein n=1 Tax=Paracoccus onubensis TaxID=1675788 RepID=A0A418SRR3_9RHOB|nr:hypothetical protein [Paracoccus onubensis]RJE83654.1 hypothetical protein D3P04_14675 [Paracoccus onubensis]